VGWRNHCPPFNKGSGVSLERLHFCPVCERWNRFLPFGLSPRPHARCSVCGSLERHRLAWLFLRLKSDLFLPKRRRLLHLGPEPCLSARIRSLRHISYIPADLNGSPAVERMDISKIGHSDGTFDMIFCSHVLEHVADDRKAMSELRRVLSPRGWAIIMVPITAARTYENPTIVDPRLRELYFGQRDHVRRYGPDFADRLRECGWSVDIFPPGAIIGERDAEQMALLKHDSIFFCRQQFATNATSSI
jgi:SAM-dependent methyltransferase